MTHTLTLTGEWRAVFSYPGSILGPTPDTYGPWRSTLEDAVKDGAPRGEETHGYRSAIQHRFVTPPMPTKLLVMLDAMPLLTATEDEDERRTLKSLHDLWLDPEDLKHPHPTDPISRYTTPRTGVIVRREDGQPAEVHTIRKDWNRR